VYFVKRVSLFCPFGGEDEWDVKRVWAKYQLEGFERFCMSLGLKMVTGL
jgi:hypothetical protein